MGLNLTDRTALITGGARGIGRACSLLLAQAGVRVMIHVNRSQREGERLREEICSAGFKAETVQADITDSESVDQLFMHIQKAFGHLDILVNNAGIIMDGLLLTLEQDQWDRVQNVNLKGAYLVTRRAVEMMLPRHAGKIINIASTSAIRGGRGQTNYAAAKGGLVSFTRACAVELAGKNIQVNAVLPGIINTQMSQRVRKRAGQELLKRIPTTRFGEPADVAGLVVFLASTMADYITGQAIAVDGGLSVA